MGTRDYVSEPKHDGYRALHLYNRRRGRLIEVQLRIARQDAWANAVESEGRQLGLWLKSGGQGTTEIHDFYVAASELFAILDRGERPPAELYERVQELERRASTVRRRRIP